MTRSPIDIGAMRHRLILEMPALDAEGRQLWTPVANVWAAITPVEAGEVTLAGHDTGRVSHRILIRHRADVGSAMRLRKGSRVFWVRAAFDPDETGRALVLLAGEDGR